MYAIFGQNQYDFRAKLMRTAFKSSFFSPILAAIQPRQQRRFGAQGGIFGGFSFAVRANCTNFVANKENNGQSCRKHDRTE